MGRQRQKKLQFIPKKEKEREIERDTHTQNIFWQMEGKKEQRGKRISRF